MERSVIQFGRILLTDQRMVYFLAFCLLLVIGPLGIRLPGQVVPFSFTLHYIMLLSIWAGPEVTVSLVGGYLLHGVLGLPVFAGGGAGLSYLLGPTGGYLMGYLLSAWVVGYLYRGVGENSFLWVCFLCLVGWLCTIIPGVLYLSAFVGIGKGTSMGVAPFIIPDIFKSLLVAAMVCLRNRKEN